LYFIKKIILVLIHISSSKRYLNKAYIGRDQPEKSRIATEDKDEDTSLRAWRET